MSEIDRLLAAGEIREPHPEPDLRVEPPPRYIVTIGGDGFGAEPEHYATASAETLRETLRNAARDHASAQGVESITAWRETACEVRLSPTHPGGFAVVVDVPAEPRIALVPVFALRPGDVVILDDGAHEIVRDVDSKGCAKNTMRVRLRGREPIRVTGYYNPIMRRVRRST